jgi:RimJ/RimL family protein N-acetyltransferase
VRLRAPEASDAERARTWMNDSEVARYLTWRYPVPPGDTPWLAQAQTSDFLPLAIETKDGEHIGAINLHRILREDGTAGLGIIIGEQAYWSNGYGQDAVRTLLRFAFSEMNLRRVWLTVMAEHELAIACYRKCGFVEEARLRQDVYRHGRFHDFVLMAILRQEFDDGGNDA